MVCLSYFHFRPIACARGGGRGKGCRVVRGRFACVFCVGSDGVARDTSGLLKKHCGVLCKTEYCSFVLEPCSFFALCRVVSAVFWHLG